MSWARVRNEMSSAGRSTASRIGTHIQGERTPSVGSVSPSRLGEGEGSASIVVPCKSDTHRFRTTFLARHASKSQNECIDSSCLSYRYRSKWGLLSSPRLELKVLARVLRLGTNDVQCRTAVQNRQDRRGIASITGRSGTHSVEPWPMRSRPSPPDQVSFPRARSPRPCSSTVAAAVSAAHQEGM